MKLKGNLIELSIFLKYGLPEVKKSYTVHVQLGPKYVSVSINLHLPFLKKNIVFWMLLKFLKVLFSEENKVFPCELCKIS